MDKKNSTTRVDKSGDGLDDLRRSLETQQIKQLGPYRIVQELGAGGMGKVYKAYHANLERSVAIKVMLHRQGTSERERNRFLAEAKLTARLKHPNIVAVHDVSSEQETDYLVMDFIDGEPLSAILKRGRPAPRKSLEIMRDVALAIAYAHANDIVHRDLKPGNIMIEKGSGRPLVMDFGLAKNIKGTSELTRSGEIIGTPRYMAPEQAMGRGKKISPRTDVYALGVILYEMLSGAVAIEGETPVNIMYNIVHHEPPALRQRNPNLAHELEAICAKAMEKDPLRRYPGARELADDIDRFLNGEVVSVHSVGWLPRLWKKIRRNKLLAGAAVALLMLVCYFAYARYLAPGWLTLVSKASRQGEAPVVLQPQVTIDGRLHAGNRFRLAPGMHRIQLALAGYDNLEFLLHLQPGQDVKLEKQLAHCKGTISINSSPDEVEATFRHLASGQVTRVPVPVHDYACETGDYEVAFHKENFFAHRQRVTIKSGKPLSLHITLCPMLVWRRDIIDKYGAQKCCLADADGNGEPEFVTFSRSGSISGYNLRSHQQLWIVTHNMPVTQYPVAICDLDRDGRLDFVVAHHHCLVAVNGKNFHELLSVPNFWGSFFVLADVNGDGYEEIVLLRQSGSECYDLQKHSLLWQNQFALERVAAQPQLLDDGTLLLGQKGMLYSMRIADGSLQPYANCGSRGPDDLQLARLSGSGPCLLIYTYQDGITCLDVGSRRPIWKWPCQLQVKSEGMTVTDIDKDGRQELLVHLDRLYCLDLQTGKERWQFATGNQTTGAAPVVADLDGDGNWEVVVASGNGIVYTVNAINGEAISEFACKARVDSLFVYDVDECGRQEICLLSADQLYAVRHLPQTQMRIYDVDPQFCGLLPATLDVDGDRYLELVVTNKSGEITCLHGETWQPLWRHRLDKPCRSLALARDIDGDNIAEVLVSAERQFLVFDRNGRLRWDYTLDENMDEKMSFTVADVNGDGCADLLLPTWQKGRITCLDGRTGKLLWQNDDAVRLYTSPVVADVDKDGRSEVVVHSGARGENGGGLVFCLAGHDGARKWQTRVPGVNEWGTIGVFTVRRDSATIILCPQTGGCLSCLDGRSGQAYWHTRLRGGDIRSWLLVNESGGDGDGEILSPTNHNDIHSLNLSDGKVRWRKSLVPAVLTVNEMDMADSLNRIIDIECDLDGDGCRDFLSTNAYHSWYLFSGKDGRWLGDNNRFGMVQSPCALADVDGDKLADMAFIDGKGRLVYIYDALSYLRRRVASPVFYNSRQQDAWLLRLAHWQNLANHHRYDRLAAELAQQPAPDRWRHSVAFYRGLCALAAGADGAPVLQSCASQFPRLLEAQVVLAIARLNERQESKARDILADLLQTSVVQFDATHRKYRFLLTPEAAVAMRRMLPKLIEKSRCDIRLNNAYQYALFGERKQDTDRFLELSLQYGLPTTPGYQERLACYRRNVYDLLAKSSTIYTMHKGLAVLDYALEIVPEDAEFLARQSELKRRTGLVD